MEAPSEAEAQASAMARAGLVHGVATEDMDALTFGTPRLIRHLTSPASRKEPVLEIDLKGVLAGLGLDMDQFIDLCILCGCDYASSIRGIGPHTALKLIQTHGSIEKALEAIDREKYKSVMMRCRRVHCLPRLPSRLSSSLTLLSLALLLSLFQG